MSARQSVRDYQARAVARELLEKVLAFANKAANAGPFQVTVVQEAALLQDINDATRVAMRDSGNDFLMQRAALEGYQPLYGAPVLLVFSAPAGPYAQINVANAATTVIIAATDLGLASGFIITPTLVLDGQNALSQRLRLPEGHVPTVCVPLGYAGDRSKYHHPRPLADNINWV
ncbi:MAG: nitroreductase family protein [Zoogloeaceae bacterium]|nr:nitroreductase family protein [Zoogloeaceae bacterium]